MDRFCDILDKAKKRSPRRFKDLCALYKADEEAKNRDLQDPGKDPDELYLEYNRRTLGMTNGAKRREIAEELNGNHLSDVDFDAIESEAGRRQTTQFDMAHFAEKLKDRNLWQWKTEAEGEKLHEEQHDEINALMDEIAGRALTFDEGNAVAQRYSEGHIGSDGNWSPPDKPAPLAITTPTRPKIKFTDKRGQPKEESYGAREHQESMAQTARDNEAALSKQDDDGKHDGDMPVGGGWHEIPGGSHNGLRRRKGNEWEYWYPSADHAAGAADHHAIQSERARKKLGRAIRSPFSTSDDLGSLLDHHIHHENESRRAVTHHGEHSKRKGPHVSTHSKSYRAQYLTMLVKARTDFINKALETGKLPSPTVGLPRDTYRELAMQLFLKAEAGYAALDPHRKKKPKPPGGEEAGWQPMKRTRHNGWEREQPNGTKEYWYPTDYHARGAEVSHRKQSADAAVNARSAEQTAHRHKHEDAAKDHAAAADGAKQFHEENAKNSVENTIPDAILKMFSDIIGEPVKSEDLRKMVYSTNSAGKDVISINLRWGDHSVAITPELLDGYDTDLNSILGFLQAGGAEIRG